MPDTLQHLLSCHRLRTKSASEKHFSPKRLADEEMGSSNVWDGTRHVAPLDRIHVDYNFSVTASNFKMDPE